MTATMLAIVKTAPGPGNVELRHVPMPCAGLTDVIVEVHAAGVCGTDLHILDDHYPTRTPVVLGHEVAGVIVEVGSAAPAELFGARVACETHHQVCACFYCQSGRRNLCHAKTSMGSFVDGGFAARVRVPHQLVHRLPDDVTLTAGAMSEPLACVCHLLLDPAVVAPGMRVLVVGPGPMGLISALVARASGGEVVIAGTEHDADRLQLGRELGFDATAAAAGNEFDVVVECSGSSAGASAALRAAAKSGHVVLVGIHGRDAQLPIDLVLYKELTVTSGFAATARSWERAMAMLGSGAIDLEPLVSSVEPLERWPEVVEALRAGRGVKVVFDPRTAP